MNQIANPFDQFKCWYDEAIKAEFYYPDAMSLTTISKFGYPENRIVLMKSFDENGFCFFTNYQGNKGKDLTETPRASCCFHWKSIAKQVRIVGDVEKMTSNESGRYFASRPKLSQIGAWASLQSEEIKGASDFQVRVAEYSIKYNFHDVPRPPHWGGFRIKPFKIEFWEEKPFRLHNRTEYSLTNNTWQIRSLYP